jgi:hypothetical protein
MDSSKKYSLLFRSYKKGRKKDGPSYGLDYSIVIIIYGMLKNSIMPSPTLLAGTADKL